MRLKAVNVEHVLGSTVGNLQGDEGEHQLATIETSLRVDRRAMMAGAAVSSCLLATTAAATAIEQQITIGSLSLTIDPLTQTAISLKPTIEGTFDFLPAAHSRAHPEAGYYALGDIELRLRSGDGPWRDYSSAFHRVAVNRLDATPGDLAAADLTPLFPRDLPLRIERRWRHVGNDLVLEFSLTNRGTRPVELGGVGLPMVFDNILTGRTLDQAHEQASFTEPYIGLDAGYVRVARLDGGGPVLLVVPESGTPLEAWKPIPASDAKQPATLLADKTPRSVTFEGFYCWMAATAGWARNEWRDAEQWNPPTSIRIDAGETRTLGVRFLIAPSIRAVEDTLAAARRPVAVGIPGYVVTPDADCTLFLRTTAAPQSVAVSPPGALTVTPVEGNSEWRRYAITPSTHWGRVRLDVVYADGVRQSIHYFVTKAAAEVVADLGRHSFTQQWFDSPRDGFGRSPSILGYDRAEGHTITSDRRVYVAGLSDEAGAGPWLAAIMKQLDNPVADEVAKFERFHTHVVEGMLQVEDGPQRYGVRKSLFYYDPAHAGDYDPAVDWSRWPSWQRDHAYLVDRSFNYLHVVAAQWTLYRLARNYVGLVRAHDWRWYLERAAQTTLAMARLAPDHVKFGQMEGDVFVSLLIDLRREGWTERAAQVEQLMRGRAEAWRRERFPFGSEMPWDSTGQEEVHAWMRHYGFADKAVVTREAILAYDSTVPHWAYNGSARRYWDFRIAAKLQREERQLHHYGSSINALPLLADFRANPDDFLLLRVGYGGLQGSLTNIDQDGFASAAFHAWPDALKFDDYSGDYGPSFFGHAWGAASYLVDHPSFGPVAFGGRLQRAGRALTIMPADSARSRCFIAPLGLWIELDAGKLASVSVEGNRVTLHLDAATPSTPAARVRLTTTITGRRRWRLAKRYRSERGAWVVPLGNVTTLVNLAPK